MINLTFLTKWRMIGESVRGFSHIRKESPNQDSITWSHQDKPGGSTNFRENVYIMAISDGHGSAKSFRSDVGSQIAVRAAKERISVFLDNHFDLTSDEVEKLAYEELVPAILSHWRNAVKSHLENTPISDIEKQKLIHQENYTDEKLNTLISSSPTVIYGATLLSVAITDKLILYLRIGDGDILSVGSDGTSTLAIEKDADLLGVETTSLCEKDADKKFRIKVIQRNASDPAMILLSTDGYSNSFASNDDFLAIGKDYLQMFRSYGSEFIVRQLPQFLTETSKKGSGDDITLGIVKRPEFFDADLQQDLIKFLDELAKSSNEYAVTIHSINDVLQEAINNQRITAERAEEILKRFMDSLSNLEQKQDSFSKEFSEQKEYVNNEFSEQKTTIVKIKEGQDAMTTELLSITNQVETMQNAQDRQFAEMASDISEIQHKQEQQFVVQRELRGIIKNLENKLASQQVLLTDLEETYLSFRVVSWIGILVGIAVGIFFILHLLKIL